jgi:hypothetical protein
MALPGMKSTADFATDERPKNYREGLMLLEPRNGASLYRLTAAMPNEAVDDPEFKWWNESVDMSQFQINGAVLIGGTTITFDDRCTRLKPGDHLRSALTGEVIRVVSVVSDTQVTVTRAMGPVGSAAGTATAIADDTKFLYIGSGYREGAPRAIGVSFNPTSDYNYTQIFRDPVEWTRTASKTRLRTGDAMKHDKRRALHKHALGIERAFFLGTRYETLESSQPLRTTGGLLDFIPSSNVVSIADTVNGEIGLEEFETFYAGMFAYGSGEKLAYTSLAVLMALQTMIRKNSAYQFNQGQSELGMNVTRFVSPAGTLVLTEHPAFGQGGGFLEDSIVVVDTAALRYRYITDTTYLSNRQDNGTDGKTDEYLTEAGLEVHNPEKFYWLKGIRKGVVDV